MSTVPFSGRAKRLPNEIERELPWNQEAERLILGSILLENTALTTVRDALDPADFFLKEHQRIFLAMVMMGEGGKAIEAVTVLDHLRSEGVADTMIGPLLGNLMDSVPRVGNLTHYIDIVREQSRRRQIISHAWRTGEDARDQYVKSEDLLAQLDSFTRRLIAGKLRNSLPAHDLVDVLSMDVSPVEHVLYPIFPVKGIGMLYAMRGAGKTFFSLEMTYCIALGVPKCFGTWEIPKARPVRYVDGEMDVETLQERLREIATGHKSEGLPKKDFFKLITPDLCKSHFMPKINTKEGQAAIEDHLSAGDVLWLDNLASLCPVSQEDETGDWIMVQDWLLHLRRNGITTMFAHHAGKSGTQRGSSVKEDVLNVVINLRRGEGYQMEDQLCAEVHLEKVRGKAAVGNAVQPFEVTLRTDNGQAEWLIRPLKHLIEKRAYEMFASGMKPNDVALDLRLSRYQVYRLRQKFDGGTRADNYLPDEN